MRFFHIGRGCLGAQPCHMVGAVYHGVEILGVVVFPLRWERMRAEAGAVRAGESRNAV